MFEEATWKLHNRRMFESIELLSEASGVQIGEMSSLSNGGFCDREAPDGPRTIAATACYDALSTLFYAPLSSFVESLVDKADPTRKSERVKNKEIKRIFKAYSPLGGARAAVFLAMSITSSAGEMARTDPENVDSARYFDELYDWLAELIAPKFLNNEDMDLVTALNLTRNEEFLIWDSKCLVDGPTEPSDESFIELHNSIGSVLALGLVMATSVETARSTYACRELEGLSQEAIARSASTNWDQFRTFLVPPLWRNGLEFISGLVYNAVKPQP